jgi:hypothetical protein
MIRNANVKGGIAIKDADSFFDPAALPDGSFASVSDVRRTPEMANIGGKSFAIIDEKVRRILRLGWPIGRRHRINGSGSRCSFL